MNSSKNKIICCTYFNRDYLIKGLCLHFSFKKYNPDIDLWILCMDDYTKNLLLKMKLKNVKLISLDEFEDRDLLKAKQNRTLIEYFWTCTPSLPLYIFNKSPLTEKIIYLDADLFFYSSIDPVLNEFDSGSIYTVEHRYPKGQESRINSSGRFNVGFQIFKRDKEAFDCLNRWRKQCLKWCYWRLEKGKLGDQLYLNEWPKLYKHLIISQNLGLNAAPWNIKQYKITRIKKDIYINNHKLICYHFHQFNIQDSDKFEYCSGYHLSKLVLELIYKEYSKEIRNQYKKIRKIDHNFFMEVSKQDMVIKIKKLFIGYFGDIYWKLLQIWK